VNHQARIDLVAFMMALNLPCIRNGVAGLFVQAAVEE